MLSIFNPSAPNTVGIDITSDTVKLLGFSRSGEKYTVESYAVVPLPSDTVVEKSIKNPEALSATIAKVVKKSETTAQYAAIAVADSSVITKVIQMDCGLSEDEIENQIVVEADKYIPYPLEEVSLDFQVLGTSAQNEKSNDILLAASRSENVEAQVQAVAEGGLITRVVDIESYAMERACTLIANQLPSGGKDETIAIVDFGSKITNLTILHNMSTIFTREEIFGGQQLTEAIQRHYGLTYAEAGLAKKKGGLPDDYVNEVLNPFKNLALLQVRRSLQFFFSASQHNKVGHIVLAGGTVSIPGLASLIEDNMGIQTSIANPFANMKIAKQVDINHLQQDAPSLMTACGLALRRFD